MPQLPSVGELIAPIIGNVPEEQRKMFLDNAELEEASAAVLEALVAAD